MAQTPLAGTGDSVGWFCRCLRSTLFNYDCNLFLCGTFLQRMLHLPDNRGLLPTPKETYVLNSIAVILRISSFRIPTSIFCTKDLYNPGLLPSHLWAWHFAQITGKEKNFLGNLARLISHEFFRIYTFTRLYTVEGMQGVVVEASFSQGVQLNSRTDIHP